jgi:hypothetical protein
MAVFLAPAPDMDRRLAAIPNRGLGHNEAALRRLEVSKGEPGPFRHDHAVGIRITHISNSYKRYWAEH